jgi:hypothetical protein
LIRLSRQVVEEPVDISGEERALVDHGQGNTFRPGWKSVPRQCGRNVAAMTSKLRRYRLTRLEGWAGERYRHGRVDVLMPAGR